MSWHGSSKIGNSIVVLLAFLTQRPAFEARFWFAIKKLREYLLPPLPSVCSLQLLERFRVPSVFEVLGQMDAGDVKPH